MSTQIIGYFIGFWGLLGWLVAYRLHRRSEEWRLLYRIAARDRDDALRKLHSQRKGD